jgi:hypothetical protein
MEKNKSFYITVDGLLCFLLILLLFFFMCFNTWNLDYDAYETLFNGTTSWIKGVEFLYYFIQRFFSNIGFSFFWFRFLILSAALCGMVVFGRRALGYNSFLFYVFYFAFPFILDTIEIRNFCGMVLALNGLLFLRRNNWKGVSLFLLFTVLAVGFQTMFVAFLPIGLLYYLRKKKHFFFIEILIGVLATVISLSSSASLFLVKSVFNLYASVVGGDGREMYVNGITTNAGIFVFIFKCWFSAFISFCECNMCKSLLSSVERTPDPKSVHELQQISSLASILFVTNLYLLLFLPLLRVSGQFGRMLQDISPLMHVVFISMINQTKKTRDCALIESRKTISVLYPAYCVFLFVSVILYPNINSIFSPLFTNNILWSSL